MAADQETVVYENGQELSFLRWLIVQQIQFESTRIGIDGSLFEVLTPETLITDGIQEELEECLLALQEGNLEAVREEAIDVMIRLFSLFAHLEMSEKEVATRVIDKTRHRNSKYPDGYYDGFTVQEAMNYAKQRYNSLQAGTTNEKNAQ